MRRRFRSTGGGVRILKTNTGKRKSKPNTTQAAFFGKKRMAFGKKRMEEGDGRRVKDKKEGNNERVQKGPGTRNRRVNTIHRVHRTRTRRATVGCGLRMKTEKAVCLEQRKIGKSKKT